MRHALGRIGAAALTFLAACTSTVVDSPKDSGTGADGGDIDSGTTTQDGGTTCSATNCTGCCFNGACQPGNTQVACGKGGGLCATCAAVRVCATTTQTCELDPNALWKVQPLSATVSSTNQGSDWDVGGGAPDPFVSLWCPSSAASATNVTPTVMDSYAPTWSTGGCVMKAKDLMSVGYAIQVWDEDLSSNDPISGKGTIVAKESDLIAGSTDLTAMPTLITMKVAYQKQ